MCCLSAKWTNTSSRILNGSSSYGPLSKRSVRSVIQGADSRNRSNISVIVQTVRQSVVTEDLLPKTSQQDC